MRVQSFEQISRIARKIHQILQQECSPGERIASERSWAECLHVSHNRVHRALQMLETEGLIWSSGGRRGLFLVSADAPARQAQRAVDLKLFLPETVIPTSQMYQVWRRICDRFHVSHPSVMLSITSQREEADVFLTWPPLLDTSNLQELPIEQLLPDSETLPKIHYAGEWNGKCYALPVLHSPACFWGHRNILRHNGFLPSDFQDPLDFFRWGMKLNESRECASGFTFSGFTYHAAQWGVELKRNGKYFEAEPERLRTFLTEIVDMVPRANLLFSPHPNASYFHRGQMALMANYLHALPVTEMRFALLGQPLRENGFAVHTAFMLSAAKRTKCIEDVYELMRFCLTEQVQKMFFMPIAHFSVLEKLYRQQFDELTDMTSVCLPPFDPRGYFPGVREDVWLAANSYYHQLCAECLSHQTRLELVVEKLKKVDVAERRRLWLMNSPETVLNEVPDYVQEIRAELRMP